MTKADGGQQCNHQPTKGSAKAGGGGSGNCNSGDVGHNGGSSGGEDNGGNSDGNDDDNDDWQLLFPPFINNSGPVRGDNCTSCTFI